jgi:hypothetical protein
MEIAPGGVLQILFLAKHYQNGQIEEDEIWLGLVTRLGKIGREIGSRETSWKTKL